MAIVIDTSMIIAWLVERQADAYSRRLSVRAESERLEAPAVWPFEFVNTVWLMRRRRLIREHEARALIDRARRLQIVTDPHPPDMGALLQLAQDTDIPAYDAAYLELALRRGLPLATRDSGQARAARAAGVMLA